MKLKQSYLLATYGDLATPATSDDLCVIYKQKKSSFSTVAGTYYSRFLLHLTGLKSLAVIFIENCRYYENYSKWIDFQRLCAV